MSNREEVRVRLEDDLREIRQTLLPRLGYSKVRVDEWQHPNGSRVRFNYGSFEWYVTVTEPKVPPTEFRISPDTATPTVRLLELRASIIETAAP